MPSSRRVPSSRCGGSASPGRLGCRAHHRPRTPRTGQHSRTPRQGSAASVKALAKQRDDAVVAKAKAGDAKAAATPLIGDGAAASVNLIASAAKRDPRSTALSRPCRRPSTKTELSCPVYEPGYIGEEQVILQDVQRVDLTQFATKLTAGLGPTSPSATYEKQLDQAISVRKKTTPSPGRTRSRRQ